MGWAALIFAWASGLQRVASSKDPPDLVPFEISLFFSEGFFFDSH